MTETGMAPATHVGQVAPSNRGPIVVPAAELNQILSWWEKTQALKAALLDPKSDMVPIGNKQFVKDSGVEKLAFAYNLTDEILREDKEEKNGKIVWKMWVRVTAPNGRQSTDVGAASSDERKFAHPDHDVYSLCHTRARNRAILGILGLGEVSAEEMTAESPVARQETSVTIQEPEWHVPTAKSEPGPGITEEPIFHGSRAVGLVYINTELLELSLVPETRIKADAGPIQKFLVSKFLEGVRAKHSDFHYALKSDSDGYLEALLVKMALDKDGIKQLLDATSWAFAKSADGKPGQ